MQQARSFRSPHREIEVVSSYNWVEARLVFSSSDSPAIYRGRFPNRRWVEEVCSNEALLLLAIGSGLLRRVL